MLARGRVHRRIEQLERKRDGISGLTENVVAKQGTFWERRCRWVATIAPNWEARDSRSQSLPCKLYPISNHPKIEYLGTGYEYGVLSYGLVVGGTPCTPCIPFYTLYTLVHPSLPCVSFLNAVHNNYEIINSNYNWSQLAFLRSLKLSRSRISSLTLTKDLKPLEN